MARMSRKQQKAMFAKKRFVHGSRDNKWHAITSSDRDWKFGLTEKEMREKKSQRALLDTPEKLKRNQLYWDGDSWIRKGFARDAHGVIVEDKNWKKNEKKHPMWD